MNKSAFVRGLPNLPASEVVAKAKAQGITLTDKYVYTARSLAKKRAGRPAGRRGRQPNSGTAADAGTAQQRFVDLALEIGLSRAEALLARLRTAIKHAVGGG